MKQPSKGLTCKTMMTFLIIAFVQTITWAQDNDASSSTTTKSVSITSHSNDWYTSPLVWIIGAAVFILLLIALMRGRSSGGTTADRTEKVTVTKSTSTD